MSSSNYGRNSTTIMWRYTEYFRAQGLEFSVIEGIFQLSSPSAQKEIIWMYGIVRVGCVPKVFDCKELVTWCAERYILGRQISQLRDHSLVSLSPQGFRKMLRLLEPTLTFKGEYCRDFLKKLDNGLDLLPEFLENLTIIPKDITRL
jgi:hypothetical protein